MANNNEKIIISLSVSSEQKDKIFSYIEKEGWNLNTLLVNNTEEHGNDAKIEPVSGTVDNVDSEMPLASPNPAIAHCSVPRTGRECQFCLCAPCVTEKRQQWMERSNPPRPKNNEIRKEKYKSFWKMILIRGGWDDPRYVQKKDIALGIPENNRRNWLPQQREIMPDCVVALVREKYPNPKNIPYMGHKWV